MESEPRDDVDVRLGRSGWIDWRNSVLADELVTAVLLVVLYPINFVVHRGIWRGGWVIKVYGPGGWRPITKTRYRSKALAVADLERQRQLAPKFLPPPLPARLPTRGGSLRRPW